MPEKLELETKGDTELRRKVESIPWQQYVEYGSVKIQIRNGKATLINIERTVKLD